MISDHLLTPSEAYLGHSQTFMKKAFHMYLQGSTYKFLVSLKPTQDANEVIASLCKVLRNDC